MTVLILCTGWVGHNLICERVSFRDCKIALVWWPCLAVKCDDNLESLLFAVHCSLHLNMWCLASYADHARGYDFAPKAVFSTLSFKVVDVLWHGRATTFKYRVSFQRQICSKRNIFFLNLTASDWTASYKNHTNRQAVPRSQMFSPGKKSPVSETETCLLEIFSLSFLLFCYLRLIDNTCVCLWFQRVLQLKFRLQKGIHPRSPLRKSAYHVIIKI